MAKLSSFLKKNNDTGFGNDADDYGGRFVNKDGSFNIKRVGVPFWEKFSMYHSMISMPTWQFFSIIILSFVLINLMFTICFWLIGAGRSGSWRPSPRSPVRGRGWIQPSSWEGTWGP